MPKLTRRGFLGALGAAATLPGWFPRLAFAAPGEAPPGATRWSASSCAAAPTASTSSSPSATATTTRTAPRSASASPARDRTARSTSTASSASTRRWRRSRRSGTTAACGGARRRHAGQQPLPFRVHGLDGARHARRAGAALRLDRPPPRGRRRREQLALPGDRLRRPRARPPCAGTIPATSLASIADFHLQGFEDQISRFQGTLAALYSGTTFLDVQALQTFGAVDRLAAVNPGQYEPGNGAEYPDTDFGNALKQVGQLIKADLGLEVACVDLGGWDMHDTENDQMPNQLADLGAGLQAFYADLHDRIGNITVVTMTEFGRRIEENASGGTDHGTASFMFVMGGASTAARSTAPGPPSPPRPWPTPATSR